MNKLYDLMKKLDEGTIDEADEVFREYVVEKSKRILSSLNEAEEEMITYDVTGIEWDADDPEDVEDLPTEMVVKVPASEEDHEEYVSDFITDETGFTHKGFSLDKRSK